MDSNVHELNGAVAGSAAAPPDGPSVPEYKTPSSAAL